MLGFLTRSSPKPTTAKLTRPPPLTGSVVKGVEVTITPVSNGKQVDSTAKDDAPAAVNNPDPQQSPPSATPVSESPKRPTDVKDELNKRRFSFKIPFTNAEANREARKPTLSSIEEHEKKRRARDDLDVYARKLSRSEKRAHESASVVRSLIIGPSGITPSKNVKPIPKARLEKVKSELIHPKSAKMVIAHLRSMPSSDKPVVTTFRADGSKVAASPSGPIHAVCLAYTDTEAHVRHFCKLRAESAPPSEGNAHPHQIERTASVTSALATVASVTNASVAQLTEMFSQLEIVSLISPDLGIGQPAEGNGLLSGSLPTAETVLQGVQQITPQLLALGYATGKAILPDHSGINPPTDRMSVITYWWGFELLLPPPSIQFLSNVPSISHAVMNFLTGLSLVNGGIREILPFIRYISQYIDSEYSMIQAQDQGLGVVCAATWIMPAALVPRPWDFPPPPPASGQPAPSDPVTGDPDNDERTPSIPSPLNGGTLTPPAPNPGPILIPNKAPPIDTTPVAVMAGAEPVPDVEVVPPTPPANETLRLKGLQVAEQEGRTEGGTEGVVDPLVKT